jgi:hypothetical protein
MKIKISNNKLGNSNLKKLNHELRRQLPPRVGKHEFGTLNMVNKNLKNMRILNVPTIIQYQLVTYLHPGSQNKRLVNPNWMKGQKYDMPFNSFHLLVVPEIFKGFATCIPWMQLHCLFYQFFIPCPPT